MVGVQRITQEPEEQVVEVTEEKFHREDSPEPTDLVVEAVLTIPEQTHQARAVTVLSSYDMPTPHLLLIESEHRSAQRT